MPNKYVRKSTAVRDLWSEEDLQGAMNDVQNSNSSVYRAALLHGIPRKTLERRLKKNNDKKGPIGPSSLFGAKNEVKLVKHIKAMQANGFPLTINYVREIAYKFAVQLNLNHKFNKENEKAGYDWMQLFLSRHPDIKLRKSEGISYARSLGMNKTEIQLYFDLMEKIMTENELFDKPQCIFNMDETGLQLNNRPGHVLAGKGSKAVPMATSTEKGETITAIVCCNAEGTYLPPVCIMKGKNNKAEFEDGLPPGSQVVMSKKSAYITTKIFFDWLKNHFVPRKPSGKVLLLLDGHSTHCNSVEMLEYAKENHIILVSMPSHTSHYLQPLDRSVFKSLKTHFYEACRLWVKQNANRRITRLQFGALLNQAWGKAASPENAISGFKACGVLPFNPGAIPEYAFQLQQDVSAIKDVTVVSTTPQKDDAVPGTSKGFPMEITPSKVLNTISPIPQRCTEVRKRGKLLGTLLTSEDHISKRKVKEEERDKKEAKKQVKTENKITEKKTETYKEKPIIRKKSFKNIRF